MVPNHLRRRDFITLLGSAASWPLAARAQQPPIPVIGYISAGSPGRLVTVFRQSLAEAGYVEGRNVAIESRSAEGQYDRLPTMAAEVPRRPDGQPSCVVRESTGPASTVVIGLFLRSSLPLRSMRPMPIACRSPLIMSGERPCIVEIASMSRSCCLSQSDCQ